MVAGPIRCLLVALLLAPIPAASTAQRAQPTGQEAFDRQDYALAAERWRHEAAEGAPEAALGLGLIHDLGMGVPRDSATALRWYLEAAGAGLSEAQFNVAVMLDAGTGAPRDAAAAATWYARAAANGNERAGYNMGLLYEAGSGVPQNPAMARSWYAAAAPAMSAAAERLSALPAPEVAAPLPAPRPLVGAVTRGSDPPRADLVWSVAAGAGPFTLQIARAPSGGTEPGAPLVVRGETDLSALSLPLPPEAAGRALAWRVGRGTEEIRWSDWVALTPGAATSPADSVLILVNPGDDPGALYAQELAAAMRGAGVEAEVRSAPAPASETRVDYTAAENRPLAEAVAASLPVVTAPAQVQEAPGGIVLHLVGGGAVLPAGKPDAGPQAQPLPASQISTTPRSGAGR
ncbi:tetratricopeptide repeat protein [Pseudoroseicyclus aestuarii]|uniref:Sel1 repeat-containing protein n=1 Tax=Pseudoroseicyclus aestuarii TaxID=1795041 RepID=A0A318SQE4_9RHOB|nr:tetratricopeptide repeat protein [Pseudoroseicyclus aestuarii]PYE84100.1 Sel1 repeat-containing protein [Pseudoroseicyclus aestuarii]